MIREIEELARRKCGYIRFNDCQDCKMHEGYSYCGFLEKAEEEFYSSSNHTTYLNLTDKIKIENS